MVVAITIIRRGSHFDGRKTRYFILALFSNILILLGYVGRDVSQQLANVPLAYFSNTLIYLFAPMSMFFLVMTPTRKIDKVIKGAIVLEAISVVIALSSPITKLFFVITPEAVYSRGPLFIYNEVIGILFTILWAVYSFIEFHYIEPIDKFYLSEIFIVQLGAIILQGVNSTYKVMYICGAYMLLVYYAFVVETYGKYDKLTGVRNSTYYYSMKRNRLPEKDFSVIILDANRLKFVNDTFGHQAGDEFIKTVAMAVTKSVAKQGSVYRVGGDEFISILKYSDENKINGIVSEIYKNLSESGKECEYPVSASVGYAVCVGEGNYDEILKIADKKMYEDKTKYYVENGIDRRRH